jgi:hypothetical protein
MSNRWWIGASVFLVAAGLLALTGCDRGPSAAQNTAPPATTAPSATRPSGVALGNDVASNLRKQAEGGDVQAMMVLGRFYESRNDREEARKWYQKASEAGDASAGAALRNLEGRDSALSVAIPPPASPDGESAPEVPLPEIVPPPLDLGGGGTTPTTGPADNEPIDRTKTRWKDLLKLVDTSNFLTGTKPDVQGQFMGISASPDKTITIAAAGKDPDQLEGVTTVIRIKNKLEIAADPRLAQVATIAAYVTRDNVNMADLVEWVTTYLKSGKRSEPIMRNGWRITVSGPAAEGIQDPLEFKGSAVMIEMKK